MDTCLRKSLKPLVGAAALALAGAVGRGLAGEPTAPVPAPRPSPLSLKIEAAKEVVVRKDGREITEYVPADTSARGDVLRFVITYTNKGDQDLANAAIVDPVPEGTVYVADSAEGAGTEITFSADKGGTFSAPPLRRTVTRPDGTTETREVPPEAYTHVRWTVREPIPPGGSGQVSFRARVQ